MFLICHSFQLACIYWDLAEVTQRKSYSFGVMPIHKTEAGEKIFTEKSSGTFYAVDSRAYQVIQPKTNHLENMVCRFWHWRKSVLTLIWKEL